MSLSVGQFVQIIGPHGEGKTTLLKLIGEVLMPKLTQEVFDSKDTLFFVPPHLSSIYVSGTPMFFRTSLLDNLTLGATGPEIDKSPTRVLDICQRLGLQD